MNVEWQKLKAFLNDSITLIDKNVESFNSAECKTSKETIKLVLFKMNKLEGGNNGERN